MNELIEKEDINIEEMIHEIRGVQVILDFDLAKLYQCTNGTKDINKAVKRNINRFPSDFYFHLNEKDLKDLWFQIGTKKENIETRGGRFNKPHAFTEQGIAMLASVLHTYIAEEVSIKIMRTFVALRHYVGNNEHRLFNIETKIIEHDNNIKLLQESFNKLEENKEINEIYFDGKIYDAYSKIIDIFSEAKTELIIVDRYIDKSLLDMIKNLDCKVILITGKNTKLTKLDIDKYNSTYNNLTVFYNDTYHDRYFIIDKNKIYHSGNSINHIGYRKSSIDILEDKSIKDTIIKEIEEIIVKEEK